MITCPCGFESNEAPDSAAWHRGHREHHMARYPRAGAETRTALDKLVALAEGGRIRPPKPTGVLS